MLISLLRKEDSMGYFFENIEKMDIQMERRLRMEAQENAAKAQKDAAKARKDTVRAQKDAAKAQEGAAKAQEDAAKAREGAAKAQERLTVEKEDKYRSWISLIREFVSDRDVVRKKLQEQFSLSDTEADQKMKAYWPSDETA